MKNVMSYNKDAMTWYSILRRTPAESLVSQSLKMKIRLK